MWEGCTESIYLNRVFHMAYERYWNDRMALHTDTPPLNVCMHKSQKDKFFVLFRTRVHFSGISVVYEVESIKGLRGCRRIEIGFSWMRNKLSAT